MKNFFDSMLKVGCIGFGGGNALIPIMHKVYVEEQAVISSTEYEEDVVVSSITPGALTVKLAGGIGRRVGGWKGMLAGFSGMAIPGVILTLVLLSVMTHLDVWFVRQVEFLTIGVSAYISCMLSDYVVKTFAGKLANREKGKYMLIMTAVFLLICGKNLYRLLGIEGTPLFSLATIDIFAMAFFVILYIGENRGWFRMIVALALCGLYVLCAGKNSFVENETIFMVVNCAMVLLSVYGLRDQMKQFSLKTLQLKDMWQELIVLVVIMFVTLIPACFITSDALSYMGNGFLSALMSFGGGDAYLTVADGMFVSTGMISEDLFYGTIVPIVNLIPGSILCKILSGIGYCIGVEQTGSLLGGYVMAMAGFACSLGASCGVVSVVGCLYRGFGELPIFQMIKKWIRPIVSALMLGVILSLLYQTKSAGLEQGIGSAGIWIMLGVYGCNMYMFYKKKSSSVKMVVMSVVLSIVLCNLAVMF